MDSRKIQGLRGHWIDIKNNKIMVLVEDFSTKELLNEYINNEMFDVAKIIKIEDQIKSGEHVTSVSGGGNCTVGFHGLVGTQNVSITAGHCRPLGGLSWKYGTTTIGNLTTYTSGNTISDAGYIELSSFSYVEVTEKITGTVIGGANDAGNEMEGLGISISAPSSSSLITGTVTDVGVEIDFGGQNGFNKISNLRLTTATSTNSGDSGAPVITLRYNSNKGRFEYIIQGIHKGLIVMQLSNGSNVTRQVYSAYNKTYNALGLSAIYVAAWFVGYLNSGNWTKSNQNSIFVN